jgi:hypothetical protein
MIIFGELSEFIRLNLLSYGIALYISAKLGTTLSITWLPGAVLLLLGILFDFELLLIRDIVNVCYYYISEPLYGIYTGFMFYIFL